jgi:CheY-like chemotaxis protein
MSEQSTYTVLLADPDARIRSLLAQQLASTGCNVLQAADGDSAMEIITQGDVRLVVAEMYLKTSDDDDLIHAIRRSKALKKTRTMAHTSHATAADREWAMRAGADAFLIKPTRAERFRYVVGRLTSAKGANATLPTTTTSSISRRDSLERALGELEAGKLRGASAIVFSRKWWDKLARGTQDKYHARAKKVGIRLRSDSMLGDHFVEVRGSPLDQALTTERSETPYRE